MNAQKLRRGLIVLCICLLTAWIITSFSLMVLWYAKGGGHGLSSDTSHSWRMFIFEIIPGLTSGYLLFGLFLLDIILNAKKSENVNP
jgi:hypothetical protein